MSGRFVNYDAIRPAPVPWEWYRKPLPPHDIVLMAADSQTIARWDGELLDELGTRKRVEEDFERICRAVNGAAMSGRYTEVSKHSFLGSVQRTLQRRLWRIRGLRAALRGRDNVVIPMLLDERDALEKALRDLVTDADIAAGWAADRIYFEIKWDSLARARALLLVERRDGTVR